MQYESLLKKLDIVWFIRTLPNLERNRSQLQMDLFSMFHLLALTPSHSSSFIAQHYLLHTFFPPDLANSTFFCPPLICIPIFLLTAALSFSLFHLFLHPFSPIASMHQFLVAFSGTECATRPQLSHHLY